MGFERDKKKGILRRKIEFCIETSVKTKRIGTKSMDK